MEFIDKKENKFLFPPSRVFIATLIISSTDFDNSNNIFLTKYFQISWITAFGGLDFLMDNFFKFPP